MKKMLWIESEFFPSFGNFPIELKKRDWDVEVVENIEESLKRLKNVNYDCIILSIIIDGHLEGGLKILQNMVAGKYEEKNENIKVMVATARGDIDLHKKLRTAYATKHNQPLQILIKPFWFKEFAEALKKTMGTSAKAKQKKAASPSSVKKKACKIRDTIAQREQEEKKLPLLL